MISKSVRWSLIGLLAIASGCVGSSGPNLGQVSGTVSIDGAPAPDVVVNFSPVAGGRASTGTTDSSGNYSLVYSSTSTGAELGQHKVSISSEPVMDDNNLDLNSPKSAIPAAYLTMTKEVQVDSGKNKIDLVFP